jgi:hypothetical protein
VLKRTLTIIILAFFTVSVLSVSLKTNSVVAQTKNKITFEVSHGYRFFSENDSVNNVPQLRTHSWLLQIYNIEDGTGQAVVNPNITILTDREFTNFEPYEPIISGEKYNWNLALELPESRFVMISANEPNHVDYASPGFSANRQVSPEILRDPVTIQNFSLAFTLEDPLPADVNSLEIYIRQPRPFPDTQSQRVNYAVLSLNSVEDWSILTEQGWSANLSEIEIGKTYQFHAQLEAVKSPQVEENITAKPEIIIIYMNYSDLGIIGMDSSATVTHPEGLTATVSAEGEYEWSAWVSHSRQDFWFSAIVPEVVEKPVLPPEIILGIITGGVAAFGAATAFYVHYQSRPPSSHKIELDLEQKRSKQMEIEEKNKKKLKSKKGKPNLIFSVSVPKVIIGSRPSQAVVNIQNRGQIPAKNILITVFSKTGVVMGKKSENILSLKPNEKRRLVFRFNISEQAKKGIYTMKFVVKSKQTPTQVKRRHLRAIKIAMLSDSRKLKYVEPLKNWLRVHKYTWSDLANSDDFLTLLRYDLLIVAPEPEVTPRGIRNIANFVENGQSLLAVDKIITSEQGVIAKTLGYQSMQHEPFKSNRCLLTIVNNKHFITRGFAVGSEILLGPCWGNACTSKSSTGQILVAQSIRREREIIVPAITVNGYGKGKALHFNFHAENSIPQLNNVLKAATDWLLSMM